MSHTISTLDNATKRYQNQTEIDLGLKKLSIYSRHDSDIVPLLSFLNISSHECIRKQFKNETVNNNCGSPPDFAANLIIELHDTASEYEGSEPNFSIKLRYNGEYMKVCGSSTEKICPYEDFKSRVVSQFVDYEKICKPKSLHTIK